MKIKLLLFFLTLGLLYPSESEAERSLAFEGCINYLQKEAQIQIDLPGGGFVSARIKSVSEEKFLIESKVVHLKTKAFDLSTEIESVIQKSSSQAWFSSEVLGEIKSHYSLLNYKPTNEISGNFKIQEGRISFFPLTWGNLKLEGSLDVLPPYTMDLSLDIKEAETKELLFVLGYQGEKTDIQGMITGDIALSGTPDHLGVKGHLEAHNGIIEDLQYDIMNLNFEGFYPIIYLDNSNIIQADGLSFNIQGDFNLSKGQSSLEEGMLAVDKLPIVDESGVHREWTIKRKQKEGTRGITEFKYRLNKSDKNENYGGGGDMISVERSIKF